MTKEEISWRFSGEGLGHWPCFKASARRSTGKPFPQNEKGAPSGAPASRQVFRQQVCKAEFANGG